MSPRRPLRLHFLLPTAVLWQLVTAGAAPTELAPRLHPPEPPERIILIVADTLRRDALSVYGGDVPTPNVERLAARGEVFTNAHASFHQTTLSTGALFAGMTPSLEGERTERSLPFTSTTWCGFARLRVSDTDTCLPENIETLAESLRGAGYWTASFVSNPLLFGFGYTQGFDVWEQIGGAKTGKHQLKIDNARARWGKPINRAVVRILKARKTDRFFLYIHYLDPHDYFIPNGIPGSKAFYRRGVERFDRRLGELLDYLEREQLLDGSLVILTADHGETLDEVGVIRTAKHLGNPSLWPVLDIPFIVAPALGNPDRMLRSEDVKALIGSAVGLPGEKRTLLADDELFYTEVIYHTYRKGNWKSIVKRDSGAHTLIDLAADPKQTRDVSAQHPTIVRKHAARIAELAKALSTHRGSKSVLSQDDRDRLEALGYLEAVDEISP